MIIFQDIVSGRKVINLNLLYTKDVWIFLTIQVFYIANHLI